MNISIIGTGNMAKGIGTRALAGGHSVTLHAEDMEKGQVLATELKNNMSSAEVRVVTVGSSDLGDITILAIPYSAQAEVAAKYKGKFAGKTVINIANPVDFQTFTLVTPAGSSAAEEFQVLVPDAKVVKAFNTTFAGTLVTGKVADQPLDVFIAGDDAEAKDQVKQLVADGGLRAIDVGPLKEAATLEALQLIHMKVQEQLGTQFGTTIKFLSA